MFKNSLNKKLISTLVVLVALVALMVAPAYAATESGIVITAGSLSGGNITFSNFSDVTLDGTLKTSPATWSIANVIDSRGTGAGWNLSLSLTQLREYDTAGSMYVTSGKAFDMSSVTLTTAPGVTLADATSSAVDTITVAAEATALDTGSPIKLLYAALDGGMGSYAISDMTVALTVPANAYACTYKTDATIALVTGP